MHWYDKHDGGCDAATGVRTSKTYADGSAVVEYAYTPDRLDAGYTLTLSNGVAFTRDLARDGFRRSLVTGISSVANGVAVESLAYEYDALGRPTTRNNDTFGYNARGEVAAATVAGNVEAHEYDAIGNSTIAAFNGVTNVCTANNLNQYVSVGRDVPVAPQIPFHYDADGNMTRCGDWTYTYDSLNRLKTVSSNGVLLVTNDYDTKGRRVRKVMPESTATFFYDGWNLIEERVSNMNGTASTIHYFWGKDISGTLQGAGGIGGLLYLTIDGAIYIPYYDNNGNVTRYLDATGNTVAQYTYDAFGNTISQSGSLAGFFRHRFSTKYFDAESGLYYYGHRFYSPVLRRWLTRDPIEERGGLNLYGFCGNNAMAYFDPHGLRIEIQEDNLISRDVIHTKARAAFFPASSVSFACSWNGVLNISGRASRRIEILTPDHARWNGRNENYDGRLGRERTNTMEWRATYSHEMDHWNAFNAFFAFLHMLNEFDGMKICGKCEEMKSDLENQYNRMWNSAMQHSAIAAAKKYGDFSSGI